MAEDRGTGQAEALGAAGEGLQLVQRRGAEGGEAEGGQGELRAFQAQGREGEQAPQQQADGQGGEEGGGHAQAQLGDHEASRVGAQAEEGHMGEVYLAQVAHGDIQPDEEDPVDGQQGEQAQGVGVHHQQGNHGQEAKDHKLGAPKEENSFHLTPS